MGLQKHSKKERPFGEAKVKLIDRIRHEYDTRTRRKNS